MDILVFDEHTLFAEALVKALGRWYVAAPPVSSVEELSTSLEALNPNVVIAHLSSGDLDELAPFLRLTDRHEGIRFVVVVPAGNRTVADLSVQAGIAGYLTSGCHLSELRLAIETVRSGDMYLTSALRTNTDQRRLSPSVPFTRCQRRVLHLRQDGLSNREIALRLGCCVKSVERLFWSIRGKLGLRSARDVNWLDIESS